MAENQGRRSRGDPDKIPEDSGDEITPEHARDRVNELGANAGANDAESRLIREIAGAVDDISLQDTLILWGYLSSLDTTHRRLYLTPSFTEYVDFRTDDYVHHVEAGEAPLSGTYVWVKREAKLLHTLVQSADQIADFLHGDITLAYLSATRAVSALAWAVRGGEGFGRRRNSLVSCVGRCGSEGICASFGGGPCPTQPVTTNCETAKCRTSDCI